MGLENGLWLESGMTALFEFGMASMIRSTVWGLGIAVLALGAGIATGQSTVTSNRVGSPALSLRVVQGERKATLEASRQAYPTRPIRIVTSEVGSAQDAVARILSQGLSGPLGQQVIVDNRASGVIPGEIVARAQPNGYTLLLYAATFWLQPLLRKNVPYDAVKDFSPITSVVFSPRVLVVHPALPVYSTKELIATQQNKSPLPRFWGRGLG